MVKTAAHICASCLLDALSKAFVYPWNGIDETTEALRALSKEQRGAYDEQIDAVLDSIDQFEDLTAAQLAYTRLFIGSFRMEAPPYGSYYLDADHMLYGQMEVEVRSVFEQFGIQLGPDEKVPADHLRYLLAFLSLLARRYEETGEEAFAEAFVDFRAEYVLCWIGSFKELVHKYAEQPYYRLLVDLIVDVLTEDA